MKWRLPMACGSRTCHLTPSDFNSVELVSSKLKTWLCTAQARFRGLLEKAICTAAA